MVIKPSITFIGADSDMALIKDTTTIITSMTDNPAYPTPAPTLAAVQTALNTFSNAVAAAADGGKTLTAAKNAARTALAMLVRELASYVHVACKGDIQKLLSSGFPTQKATRQPLGILPAPSGLSVSNGARSGEINAWATPVNGAGIYNWNLALASAPDTIVQTVQTTAASVVFDGLTPGLAYNVEVNVVGSAGPSDWTDPVSQFVI